MRADLFRLAPPPARRRHTFRQLATSGEACEQRILLSATPVAGASTAAKVAGPRPPKIVRAPSSGGPNGTSFLANDASTPPNWEQQQSATVTPPLDSQVNSTTPALNEASLPVSGAFNVGPGVGLNGPPPSGSVFGSPAFGNLALNDQSLGPSQANYSTQPFGVGSASVASPSSETGNGGPNALNAANSLNGLGEILPLPHLDLAFTQTLDMTSPTGW